MQKKLLFSLLVFLCYLHCAAQSDTTTPATDSTHSTAHSYFKARASYLSNNVYNGRKDSLPVPYFTPILEYFHKSGFFAKASLGYQASSYAQRIDMYELEAGYQFELNENFSGTISGSKPFYNSSSVSVLSETKANFNAGFSWNIANATDLNTGAGIILTSAKADKFVYAGLSHEFTFGNNQEWSIEPALTANFSTRNYYQQYQRNRRLKNGKIKKHGDSTVTTMGNQKVVVTTAITTENANRLVMLDSEVSLSIYYDMDKWSFFAIPTLAIPTSPATYITTIATTRTFANGSVTHNSRSLSSTESIANTFYMEAGLSYRF